MERVISENGSERDMEKIYGPGTGNCQQELVRNIKVIDGRRTVEALSDGLRIKIL